MLRQSSERLLDMECACSSADRVPGYEPVGRGFESPQARQKKAKSMTWLFSTKCSVSRNVKYASQVKCTSCVKCPFGTITEHLTSLCAESTILRLGASPYFTAATPLLHLVQPNFNKK